MMSWACFKEEKHVRSNSPKDGQHLFSDTVEEGMEHDLKCRWDEEDVIQRTTVTVPTEKLVTTLGLYCGEFPRFLEFSQSEWFRPEPVVVHSSVFEMPRVRYVEVCLRFPDVSTTMS